MKTYALKERDIRREWCLVDAKDKNLGRLASEIAKILRGKHKPTYSPHLAMGDYVVVINAEQVRVTGRKLDQKMYHRHSGYPGGLRSITLREQLKKHPDRALKAAVRGMLPHNRLGRQLIKGLKIYAGGQHPHQAQQPKPIEL